MAGGGRPLLIVVSGPAGAGKTTLAHALAGRVGCPAICRDEIKEGMAHATPGFAAAPGDPLTLRTLPAFFGVLRLLLESGVTTVAEAAFQDHVWRPRLEPLRPLAELRIVHCVVPDDVAAARRARRTADVPTRRAHADAQGAVTPSAFRRPSLDAPAIEVDTSDGYLPDLDDIVAFINRRTNR
ncbi:MAG TPA: AAA family ATPase [Actinospica sp.]|jgi:predicted kinase|nr:AAA family ATPase [Actinospica sp.]